MSLSPIPGNFNRSTALPGRGGGGTGNYVGFAGTGGSTGLISSGVSNIGSSFNFGSTGSAGLYGANFGGLGGFGGIGGFGGFGGIGGFGGFGGFNNGAYLGAMIGAGIATMIAGIGEFIAYKRENSNDGGEDCQNCKGQGHPDMNNYNSSRVAEYRDEGGFNMSFGDDSAYS